MSNFSSNMQPEYESFLKALEKIADYAVDLAETEKHTLSDVITYEFSQDEFFGNLYVPRIQEQEIRSELNTISNFLVLVGGRGSGKTCLALKIVRDLDPSNSFGYFVTYIDVRTKVLRSYSHTLVLTPEEAVSDLMDKIKNSYLNKLFPTPDPNTFQSDTPDKRLELIAFLLNSHNEMPDTYQFLTSLQFEAAQLFKQYKTAMVEERRNHTMNDWIQKTIGGDERVFNLVKETHSNITPSMVAHAAKELRGIRHQIIWIDNVDILTEKVQGLVQLVSKNVYARIKHIASVIVSVREQNIFRDYDLDEPGSPPSRTEVRLYTSEQDRVYAHELGQIHEDAISNLISKRLYYAREVHSREVNRALPRLAEAQAQLDKVRRDDEERERRQMVVGQLQSELNTLGPNISKERFDHCFKLSSALVDQLQKHKAVYFCNGDIRQILNIHADCLGYLLSRPKSRKLDKSKSHTIETPLALDFTSSQITTLFLMRLRDREISDEEHPISTYDVIRNMEAWYSNGQITLGCFLEHLIITATWNLSLNQQGTFPQTSSLPTIGSLIRVLNKLDFTKDEILNGIMGLYDNRNRVGLIEIQAPDISHISDINQIKESDLVRVTPRGKCLIANLSNTFGYTYACFRQLYPSGQDDWHPAMYTEIALRELMPILCDLAWMHLNGLKMIRDKRTFGHGGWLDRYRSLFGIPTIESVTRHSLLTTGKVVNRVRRALQCEILIPGIIQHAPEDKSKKDLEALLRAYNKILGDVEFFRAEKIPSFREMLELPERSND